MHPRELRDNIPANRDNIGRDNFRRDNTPAARRHTTPSRRPTPIADHFRRRLPTPPRPPVSASRSRASQSRSPVRLNDNIFSHQVSEDPIGVPIQSHPRDMDKSVRVYLMEISFTYRMSEKTKGNAEAATIVP